MIFTSTLPLILLVTLVNAAALPRRQDIEARDFLDDIGEVLSNAVPIVESLIQGLIDPTPTNDDGGVLITQYPAPAPTSATFTIPGTPLQVSPGPTGTSVSRRPSLSLAGPFPSLAVVDPHNPSGIRLPGTPFMITAPAAVAAPAASASAGPTKRSQSNEEGLEKRIDVDNIVNAFVSALPSAVQEKVAPLVHVFLPGTTTSDSTAPTSSPTQTGNNAVVTTGPLHTPNSARSLKSGPFSTLTNSVVVVASVIFGATVAF